MGGNSSKATKLQDKMESCSSSVATDQTDRCSNFSVISSLSQVGCVVSCTLNIDLNSFQLHELSTINGMVEEDLLARREDAELPGLHGASIGGKEEARPVRRPSRVRPKLHVKTEQKSLAARERNHLERRIKEAASQGETITQLKRRELFLTRFV